MAETKPQEQTSGSKGPFSQVEIQQSIHTSGSALAPHFPHEHAVVEGVAPRNFSLFSIIGLAYAILNSWTAMAASLSLSLPSGGPSATIWGIAVSMIGNLCVAASLAEMASVYPTSGGQYHWSCILSPPAWAPIISWICGWFAVAGWIALVATTGSLAGQLVTGAYALTHAEYEVQPYQIFVVYLGFILCAVALNIWGLRLLPFINKTAIIWSLAGAVTIAITCLACSSGDYQSGKFVFGEFINETGWSDGTSWLLGLLQSSFGLTGFDAVSHMVEEMPNPSSNAPKAMILAVLIGASSSFVFLICLLFSIKNVDLVNSAASGALLQSMYQATGSVAGAICLQVFPIVSMMYAAQGILLASSRMTQAFARDGGLPFSTFFAKQNRHGVPVNSICLSAALVIIFGLVYLGSSSALNAILSSSVVALNVSYSIPIIILIIRGRHLLRPESFPEPAFSLGPILGRVANIVGVCFTALTTVLFVFPPDLPVTGSNMNYTVVVFFIVFCISAATWIFQGRKTFTGPKDLGALLELARTEIVTEKPLRDVESVGSSHAPTKPE